jgi:type II secretory pathway pseudopilin PulG
VTRLTANALRDAFGYSLVEVMIMLSIVSVLSAIAAPAVESHLTDAQLVRARTDVRVIGVSLIRMVNDVRPQANIPGGWSSRYDLLVGAGERPRAETSTAEGWAANDRLGQLDDHLLTNNVGYTAAVRPGLLGWRGAYIDRAVEADPWGNRYATNIGSLAARRAFDTIVLSAGPDGVAAAPFAADGLHSAGDDIIALVSSGAN